MAAISGKYGSVQRILPYAIQGGRPQWKGFSTVHTNPNDDTSPISNYVWDIEGASNRWDKSATPTYNGQEPSDANHAQSVYSNTVSAVSSWSLENTVQTQSYAASNTRGYNAKFAGIRSCTGSISGIGAFPPLNPGNRFLFRGFVGPESGNNIYEPTENELDPLPANARYANTDGMVYQVAAVVTGIRIQINYSNFSPITWTVQWQSDYSSPGDELLAFGVPGGCILYALGFYDQTPPPCMDAIPSTKHMLVIAKSQKDAKDGVFDDVCLESANISFTTQTQQIANSCSAVSGGWQQSVIGVTDVTLDATIHSSRFDVFSTDSDRVNLNLLQRSKLHYPGFDRYVRIYVGNADDVTKNGAWEFNKMFLGSYTGLNVDITSGNVVSFRTQMEFNAFPQADGGGDCKKGFIRYRLPNKNRQPGTNNINNWVAFKGTADWDEQPADGLVGQEDTFQNGVVAYGWTSFLDLNS